MAVQLILKNSAVQDNHPTAAQLSRGEIALNFHESGPYLSCEDSAGVVKRIAGVTQSATAPSSPLEGTFWWNTGTNQLLLRAENAWHQLGTGGGGGGGGGAVDQLIGGDGVAIDPAGGTGTVTINIDEGNGLTITGGQVVVNLAGDQDGLEFTGGALRASIATADQLGSIRVGNNLTINPTTGVLDATGGGTGGSTNLSVDNRNASTLDVASSTGTDATIPAATTALAGLMTAADKTALDAGTDLGIANRDATDLDVTSSSGDDVTIPAATTTLAGLLTAADKVIIDGIADPLSYQGLVNLTDNTTIPDPGTTVNGHTWANTTQGTADAGWAAVSTLTAGDAVNPGDLVVWNGTTWTYIPTGGVGGTTVTLADEAPFEAAPANEGALWFNTDDLRLFISYTDGDGDSQWVDTNPGGAGGGGGAAFVGENPPEAATDANEGEFWFNDDTGQLFISYTDPDDSSSNWIAAAPPSTGGGGGTPDLQDVTDEGNTTTNEIVVSGQVNIGSGPGTGGNNSRFGAGALAANTTGENNVAIGNSALDSNTEGSSNVGVGRNALGLNVGGDQNVAVGQSALGNNGTGDNNNAVGWQALNDNVGGINNNAFGTNALADSTGNNNIGIGHRAGVSLTTGGSNTIIGSLAGAAGMANTMLFGSGTTERFRVDANGRFLVGPNSSGINVKAIFQGSSLNADAQGIVAIARGSDGTGGVRTLGTLLFTNNAHAIGAEIGCNTAEAWTATTRPSHLIFSTNGGGDGALTEERMRIASDGRIILPDGSPGIAFEGNDTSGAGVDSKSLDDYEEGTWTPTLTSGTNVFTHTTQDGVYTKVGRLVCASAVIQVELTTINSANSQITVELPFNSAANETLTTPMRVSNGGSNWGAQVGQPANTSSYNTRKIGVFTGTTNKLEMGFANTAWYPDNTTVTLQFNATYQSND